MIAVIKNACQMVNDLLRYRLRGMFVLHQSIDQASLVDKLKRVLAGGKPIGVIFLDIVKFHEIQQMQGSIMATRILFLLEEASDTEWQNCCPKPAFWPLSTCGPMISWSC